MHYRNKAALGFLASAVLLSGSAFAFSPEFDDALPTVVITDKLEADTNLYDPGVLSSQYLFRYTDAFNPFDYINLQGNDQNSVRFLFNEFDDSSDVTPNMQHTLSINNVTASNIVPTDTDFGSAPFLATSPAGATLDADFRNIDFSPGVFGDDTPGTATGVVTGDNIDSLGSQSRIVSLYVKSDDAPDVSAASMLVVTKRETGPDGGDTLSDPFFSDPFNCIFSPSDMAGWQPGAIGLLQSIPLNGPRSTAATQGPGLLNISGFSNSPSVAFNGGGTSAGGTGSLGLTSNLAQIGFASWTLPAGSAAAATAGNLYRGRVTVLSANAATAEQFRFRLGNSQTGIGEANHGYFATNPASAPGLQTSATDFYTYVFAKDSGDLQMSLDLIDQNGNTSGFNGTGNEEFTASAVEICEATRSGLGSGTMIFNVGGVPGSVASGQGISPEPSPTAFNTGSNFDGGASLNAARPITTTPSAAARTFTFGTVSVGDPVLDPATDFARTGYANSLTLENGKLYAVDVWVSTNNAAASPKPQLRIEVTGNNYYADFNALLDPTVGGNPNPAALTSSAKVYSLFFEPQLQGTSPVTAGVFLDLLELVTQVPAGTSVTIHQVTAWEWSL